MQKVYLVRRKMDGKVLTVTRNAQKCVWCLEEESKKASVIVLTSEHLRVVENYGISIYEHFLPYMLSVLTGENYGANEIIIEELALRRTVH